MTDAERLMATGVPAETAKLLMSMMGGVSLRLIDTPPASSNSPGVRGQCAYDETNDIFMVCYATNQWCGMETVGW